MDPTPRRARTGESPSNRISIPLATSTSVNKVREDLAAVDFETLSVKNFLKTHPAPHFVIDNTIVSYRQLPLIYANAAMRDTPVHEHLAGTDIDPSFWYWCTETKANGTCLFAEAKWTRVHKTSRYTIIAGEAQTRQNEHAATNNLTPGHALTKMPSNTVKTPIAHEAVPELIYRPTATEFSIGPDSSFTRFFTNYEWDTTSLGPLDTWSDALKSAAGLLLADPRPSCLLIGPDHLILWNEAYIPVIGPTRHPSRWAEPFDIVYPEVVGFTDLARAVGKTRKSMLTNDVEFTLFANGINTEHFFNYSLIPLYEADAVTVTAIYNPVFEVTNSVISERRMTMLTRLGINTSTSRSVDAYWSSALDIMKGYQNDFFAAAVHVPFIDDTSSASSTTGSGNGSIKKLKLVDSFNIPPGHAAAADNIGLDETTGFAPHLRRAALENIVVELHSHDSSLPADLAKGISTPVGEPCRSIIIIPIKPVENDDVAGLVVFCINPRRPWDANFATFLQVLSRMMSASMAAAVFVEGELKRSRLAAERAANEHRQLEAELALQTKRAKTMNMRFTEFADKAPISIFILDAEGRVVYANELWRKYTGYPLEDDDKTMGWLSVLDMTQVKDVEAIWHRLNVEHQFVSYETRLLLAQSKEEPPWIMCNAYPEVNAETGAVESIVGSFTDITPLKKAELLQQKRSEDAIAAKKLQEAFVDITSHELRNPMSVVLMCCEAIIGALGTGANNVALEANMLERDALASSLDAANTIMHCVTHQRRIVDDILTLSKLDSDLLPVAPIRSNILESVNAIISMFTHEFKSADIALHLLISEDFKKLGIDDVYVDPSRLAQVLINILTNAIKFTQGEPVRKITISVAASMTKPTETQGGVHYIPRNRDEALDDVMTKPDCGNGSPVYLMFAVQDSGRGLTDSEKDILFRRFSQASPRTHVQYGGSGLGLFISRELTERQGGQIGVSSVAGKGSTFAFFVKGRQAEGAGTTSEASAATAIVTQRSEDTVMRGTGATPTRPRKHTLTEMNAVDIPVLIVEDNLVNRRVLKKQLTRLGFPILEAGHGVEALEILRASKYWSSNAGTGTEIAVIACDWEMPIMDGITFIKEVRRLEKEGAITAHIPTIAVTANARREQIDIALEAGMDDVVSKPFTTADLVNHIKQWAAKREE